jgi:glycosyltransferase involved in cell wall biosynthesis
LKSHVTARGILFVGHDAVRAGAQIELLHFLRWFRKNSKRPFSVLLGVGGELEPDFQELADTWSIDLSRWGPDTLWTHILVAVGLGTWAHRAEASDVRRFADKNFPALVYTNSVASARVLEILAPDVPVLSHVHELEFYFRAHPGRALSSLLARTDQFIACSNATQKNLTERHGVPATRIETVHESISVAQVRAKRTREQIFQELQIPVDGSLVVGCGTIGWRKGTDLFVHLARIVSQRRNSTYFAWIGSGPSAAEFEHDICNSGLSDRIRLTGPVLDPYDYMGAADLFVLTSREDPYPLVCLEAAALEKPIVCFDGAGGMPEFVENDCGFVVPYLDIAAMADRVVSLLDAPERLSAFGLTARQKVLERHDISKAAPRILQIIERTIERGRAI